MKKGFTLVELLVVIAIIAVLGTAVVLVLNPSELLKQSRDSTRLNDLTVINKSIVFYLSQTDSPGLGGPNGSPCSAASSFCTSPTATSPFSVSQNGCGAGTPTSSQKTDGQGWVKVDFESLITGSPISRLPLDPLYSSNSSGTYYYAYACNGLYYELDTNFESAKYATSEIIDGGNRTNLFEVGNKLDI